jgi:hypothetical protein
MPIWTLDTPPKSYTKIGKNAVATESGWEDSETGEVLVAIRQLATVAGEANVIGASFAALQYAQGEALKVVVRFNEKVNVTAGATLLITWSANPLGITAYAAGQLNVSEVAFDKDSMGSPLLVPMEAGELSLAAQTISGTVKDASDGLTDSNLSVSADVALAAGTRVVA